MKNFVYGVLLVILALGTMVTAVLFVTAPTETPRPTVDTFLLLGAGFVATLLVVGSFENFKKARS